MKLAPSLGLLVCVLSSSLARAQDDSAPFASPPPKPAPMAAIGTSFGATGQWIGSMRTGPGSGYAFFHKPSGGDWAISIHPAIDYIIASRVSIGGVFGYTHTPAQTGTTTLDFGARAGFALDISGQLGIWPTAGIGAQWASANHTSSSSSALQIFAPFLYHPAQHVFVGLGPEFQAGLSGGDYTEYGVDFILGGWM